jgi:hypothetical protein
LSAETDGPLWPRLLACWHHGSLQTSLLHIDGRRSHERETVVETLQQLPPALAQALVATHRVVRHAVLVSDDTPPREALRATLGLITLCFVTHDRALGLALTASAPTRWLVPGSRRDAPVFCRITPATLIDEHGHSPAALTALLHQPWRGSRLGSELHQPQALAMLCGLLSLAGHGLVTLDASSAAREALTGFDWHSELARIHTEIPAIAWSDPGDGPCWPGAARALDLALRAPESVAVSARIRAVYAHLTRSERRVADVVLASPTDALEMATARLAEAALVSQPQVIRFCRALGFAGVKTLKRALAASLASGNDGPVRHPLLAHGLQALEHLDRTRLADAARLLCEAQAIDVCADAERLPLLDLALRMLWRLGLPARPAQAGATPGAAVCLALGSEASTGAGKVIVITEQPLGDSPARQIITGIESPSAPLLLATLAVQLLMAETAAFQRRRAPQPSSRLPSCAQSR